MSFVEFISGALHHHLLICVALAVVPLKLLMVRISKDQIGEVETMLAVPEDVCYVTVGLILSSLSGDSSVFREYFSRSPYVMTNGVILLVMNFMLAVLVHKIASRWSRPQYQTWRAALEVRINHERIPEGGMTLFAAEDDLFHIYMHHFLSLLFSVLVQVAAVGAWIYWIGRIYAIR